MIVVIVLLVAVAAFVAGCVFMASRARLSRRGGYVDLSVAATRGEIKALENLRRQQVVDGFAAMYRPPPTS